MVGVNKVVENSFIQILTVCYLCDADYKLYSRSLRDEEMGRLKTRIDDLLVDQKQLREENLELKERYNYFIQIFLSQ